MTKHTPTPVCMNCDRGVHTGCISACACTCQKHSPKHASIPWEVAHYEGCLLEGVNVIRQVSSKKDICTLGLPTEEDEANGAFIVRAVNSHDELLHACKVALDAMTSDKADGMPVGQILEDAIAKAEGL